MAEKVNPKDDISEAKAERKRQELEGWLDPDASPPPVPPRRNASLRGSSRATQDQRDTPQEQQQRQQVASVHHHPVVQVAVPQMQVQKVNKVQEDPVNIEWQYVDEPDESLLCEICFTLVRDPRLLNCCGEHNACKECIDRASVRNKACPFCRSENFKLIPNNDLKIAAENVRVWCPNKAEGCRWSGTIGDARLHLTECQHSFMLCPRACGLKLKRYEMDEHERTCLNLPVSCQFANIGCKEKIPQKGLSQHNRDNIHKHLLHVAHRNEAIQKAALTSSHATDKYVEKCLADKLAKLEALKRHLANSQQSVRSLEQKIDNAKKKLLAIREEHQSKGVHYTAELQAKGREILQLLTISRGIEAVIDKLPVPPVEGYTAVPITFTIDNFSARKQNDEIWVSPPFYTHVAGYKMCLEVYPNGYMEGKGTHLSAYVHMMQGENDNHLPWPFPGAVITILIINQRGTMKNMVLESFGHATMYITIDGSGAAFCQRVTDGTCGSGWGYRKAIANAKLGRYVINDVMQVKVHKVDFLPL